MPYKSRKNRRIPQSKVTPRQAVAPASSGNKPSENQPLKASASASSMPAAKPAMGPEATYPFIANELKWIAIVTVITAVVLVAAYYIFR
jgi:hypothetical protein